MYMIELIVLYRSDITFVFVEHISCGSV